VSAFWAVFTHPEEPEQPQRLRLLRLVAQDPGLPVAVSRASVTNNCLAKTEACVILFQMTGSDGGRRGEGKRAGSQATGPAWNILREEIFYLNQP
jgi:hypothetical protein